MKLTIQMALGSNEQAIIEIPLKDVQDWDTRVAPAIRRLEQRVGERNARIMAANKQLRDLAVSDPATAFLVQNLVALALGGFPESNAIGLMDGVENNVPVLEKREDA